MKIVMFLVTPKAGAKHELLFNKSLEQKTEAGSLNKSSCLAPTSGVTKIIKMRD
jgi:hypothetical protein